MLKFFIENKESLTVIATMTAALIPGIVALIALYQISMQKRAEQQKTEREHIRTLISQRVLDIGEASYEVLAQANILVSKYRKNEHKMPKEYYEAIQDTKDHIDAKKAILIEARRKDRYSLFGLEDGYYSIARVADWIKALAGNEIFASALLNRANRIRKIADRNIIRIKIYGKLPSQIDIYVINMIAGRILKLWDFYRENEEKPNGIVLNAKRKLHGIKYIKKEERKRSKKKTSPSPSLAKGKN